jgi:hypothetical protein
LNRLKKPNRAALCYRPHLSLPRRAAPLARVHSRTQPPPPGPRVITPHLSAVAPASLAPPPPLFAARPPRPCDVHRLPLSERPGATVPVPCRLRQHRTLAPPSSLLLLPPCGTKPDPPALFLPVVPPSRHTKATPDAIPRFARFPHASTGAPRLLPHFLPLDAPSTHGDREAPDRTRPRWFPPELRRRPPLSVSVT